MTNEDLLKKDSAGIIENLIKKIKAEWDFICEKYDDDEAWLRLLHWNFNFYELNEFIDIRKMQENNFTQVIIIPNAIYQACNLTEHRDNCYCTKQEYGTKQELVQELVLVS